ncbi:Spermidine/putrescine import ABC transporter permease protein PotB (TC 3.A.1.11.1) [Olavius sp. associated proteobacterium Delta 1]|nr:Spermidine/putrescine import ABC transporter permease protein PotB (TC 3.A.1.11.1) [Olavius sp. associated proteobacterium Delta 1]
MQSTLAESKAVALWQRPHVPLLFLPVLFFFAFLVVPQLYMLAVSFFTYKPMEIFTTDITIENYLRFVKDPFYRRVLLYTVWLAFSVTFFSLLLGYPLSYFLARTRSSKKGFYIFLLLVPLMVGIIVRTYGWIVLLGREGLVNNLLIGLNLTATPVKILNTHTAVVVGIVEVLMPYMVLPIVSAIQKIPVSLEEAASSLGANRWYVFVHILIPQSLPGVLSGSIIVFTLTAGAIVTPALLGGPKIHTMGTLIYQLMISSLNWPFGSATAFILLLMEFVIVLLVLNVLLPVTRRGRKT